MPCMQAREKGPCTHVPEVEIPNVGSLCLKHTLITLLGVNTVFCDIMAEHEGLDKEKVVNHALVMKMVRSTLPDIVMGTAPEPVYDIIKKMLETKMGAGLEEIIPDDYISEFRAKSMPAATA